jgi:hypothetical protein
LKNFERGEIVSPVGCIASKLSGLNLATPDSRIVARSNSLYCQSVKNQPSSFSLSFSGEGEAKFHGKILQICSFDFEGA